MNLSPITGPSFVHYFLLNLLLLQSLVSVFQGVFCSYLTRTLSEQQWRKTSPDALARTNLLSLISFLILLLMSYNHSSFYSPVFPFCEVSLQAVVQPLIFHWCTLHGLVFCDRMPLLAPGWPDTGPSGLTPIVLMVVFTVTWTRNTGAWVWRNNHETIDASPIIIKIQYVVKP